MMQGGLCNSLQSNAILGVIKIEWIFKYSFEHLEHKPVF